MMLKNNLQSTAFNCIFWFIIKRFAVEPTISINGEGNIFSGETAQFLATKENADSWILIWEKVNGRLTERIDVTSEKYKDSGSTDLVILCVSKPDEGLYHASLIQDSEKQRRQISSNDIELHIVEEGMVIVKYYMFCGNHKVSVLHVSIKFAFFWHSLH